MTDLSPALLTRRALAWTAGDCEPADVAEIQALLDAGDVEELADRFSGPLTFGTAGLRGRLRAGPNGMNRAVVRRAAHGLIRYLADTGAQGPLVIGYDARHGSADFAADTARVATAAGRPALLLPGPLPTPVLAFAVGHLGAAAGVMVTASHNPPQDNGYKVYLGRGSDVPGAQIAPPADAAIADRIQAAPDARDVPLGPDGERLGDEVVEAYLDAVARLADLLSPDGPRELTVVATAMHGVGADLLRRALVRCGFAPPVEVAAQAQPDPDFPTVALPNPEEPGALDLALALAAEVGADLVVANDPDADRLALAGVDADGVWRALPGDRTGCLLADQVLGATAGERTCATTIVSSTLLGRVAAAHDGATAHRTLTGFKWLVRAPGRLVVAYEEALGVAVGTDDGLLVADKDGIAAAVAACCLVAEARARGRTLWMLDGRLDRDHGVHRTAQVSVRLADPAATVARVVAGPPSTLGGLAVEQVIDLSDGLDGLPPTDGLLMVLADGVRVVLRPSGTEPKAKAYVESVRPATHLDHLDDDDGPYLRAEAAEADRLLAAVGADLRALLA